MQTRRNFIQNKARSELSIANEQNNCSGLTENNKKGFTLVELSLALTFLAFIMLFVVIMILRMMNIYNKSVALSHMNQAGRQIMTDLGGSVRFSNSAVYVEQTSGGRLCVGGASYIWNIKESTTNKFQDNNSALRLVRVSDPMQQYCSDAAMMPSSKDAKTNSLVGTNVLVQNFDVETGGGSGNVMVRANVTLSTAGNNQPEVQDGKLKCSQNDFCAFIPYNFVTYQRGAK